MGGVPKKEMAGRRLSAWTQRQEDEEKGGEKQTERGGERNTNESKRKKQTKKYGGTEKEKEKIENENEDKKYAPSTRPKALASKLWLILSMHPHLEWDV
jgi:hypothetical protein